MRREKRQSVEEILKGIDLKPIIREEMAKVNPDVEEKEIDEVVSQINLAKVAEEINKVKFIWRSLLVNPLKICQKRI